jgi:competence protein ComFB
MAFKDDYEFDLLINEAESLVIDELEKQLSEDNNKNICKCQECILDMATLALNNIKPKYRSSFTGLVYSQQYHTGEQKSEIDEAVAKAVSKVSKNPSHDTIGK